MTLKKIGDHVEGVLRIVFAGTVILVLLVVAGGFVKWFIG